jgi:hypothetical protein
LFDETSLFGDEVGTSLGLKDVHGCPPTALDCSPSLSQCRLAGLYADTAREQFICHRLRARTGLRGVASKRRAINAICLMDSGRARKPTQSVRTRRQGALRDSAQDSRFPRRAHDRRGRLIPTNAISFISSPRKFSACSMLDVQKQLGTFSYSQSSARVSAGVSSQEKITKYLELSAFSARLRVQPGEQRASLSSSAPLHNGGVDVYQPTP